MWFVIILSPIVVKELTLRTGNEIILKVIPVDPRDLFRGDYVTLSYEISMIDLNIVPSDKQYFARDDKAYVILLKNDLGFIPTRIDSTVPTGETLFIMGIVQSAYNNSVNIKYGIESYFVPEGKGRIIERARGKNLLVKAAVDKKGNAVIKELLLDGKEFNDILKKKSFEDEED